MSLSAYAKFAALLWCNNKWCTFVVYDMKIAEHCFYRENVMKMFTHIGDISPIPRKFRQIVAAPIVVSPDAYQSRQKSLNLSDASSMPQFCFHRRQSLQNAAGVHGLLALATLAQLAELLLELRQLGYSHIDMRDVFIQ